MLLNQIDKKISQAFSNAALEYDVLTGLHKEIGRDLVKDILKGEEYQSILDVGMGTGWLTNKVKFYYPEARVMGLDFASGMIDFAKEKYDGLDFIQGDANYLPFKKNSIDLVFSNLAYQWVNDLEKAFVDVNNILTSNGRFKATLFGANTFDELFVALKETSNDPLDSLKKLMSFEEVKDSLQKANFKEINLDYEQIKIRFKDMMALLKWIKEIGANCLDHNTMIGKDLLLNANEYYNQRYRDKFGVYATFEVIWIDAKKN